VRVVYVYDDSAMPLYLSIVVEVPDVRAIRKKLGMSQEQFAQTYRIPLATLKNWEQGRRHPDAPAAAYLRAIARRPRDIGEALTV